MRALFKSELIALLPRLRRVARTMARTSSDVDDLVQEACIRALATQSKWDPEQPLDRWVFRIMRNVWIDEVRKRKVRLGQGHVPAEDTSELVARETGETQFAEKQLYQKIEALPSDLAIIILTVSVEGYSYAEASEFLDIPIGTVMSRMHRARKYLAAELAVVQKEKK